MSQTKIKKLTPKQEALIPVYRDKWRDIALSTGPINRSAATETIQAAYAAIGKKKPKIFFCDRPYQAAPIILSQINNPRSQLRSQLETKLRSELEKQLQSYLRSELESKLRRNLQTQRENLLFSELESQLWRPQSEHLASEIASQFSKELSGQQHREPLWKILENQVNNCIKPEFWACCGSLLDFCISVLKFPHSYGGIWKIFQGMIDNCGWIFPYETVCIVCEKPLKLSVDSDSRLHAEGEPAVRFADGFSIYAYHGVILPQWYGNLHPHQWQSKWVLKENNAEVRRSLIQGIGYDRICQELEATELDNWQEYALLKINVADDFDSNDNELPVYLLKMTCPSTGFIHALRVPPDVKSAREAIRWVNWEIDPEEFSVQT